MVFPLSDDNRDRTTTPVVNIGIIVANVIVGYVIANHRARRVSIDDPNKDIPVLERGDEAIIVTVSGQLLKGGDEARNRPSKNEEDDEYRGWP